MLILCTETAVCVACGVNVKLILYTGHVSLFIKKQTFFFCQ